MFSRTERDTSWHWKMGFSANVDFALWVLEQDGLHAPPFDKHAAVLGSGRLAALGLTVANWLGWLRRLAAFEAERELQDTTSPVEFFEAGTPSEDRRIRAALYGLYNLYRPVANTRRYVERAQTTQLIGGRRGRATWQRLETARGDLPPMHILLMGYPHKAQYAVAPSTVIMALGGAIIHQEEWETVLLQMTQSLHDLHNG